MKLEMFSLKKLLLSLMAGLITGVIGVSLSLSFAILIFSRQLSDFIPAGIGFTLFGGLVFNIVVALVSSARSIVAIPQESPAAILAVVVSAITASMSSETNQSELFTTIALTISLTTLLTGICYTFLGWLKLGNLIRFIPYPVVGGFLAGTGWLLLKGGIEMLSGVSLQISQLSFFLNPNICFLWLSGVLFGIALLFVSRRYRHWTVVPGGILLFFALFYAILAIMQVSLGAARQQGWLLDSFVGGSLWRPVNFLSLAEVHWSAIASQWGTIVTIILLCVVGLLLNASGIELATQQEVNLNQELKAIGWANVAASLGGGLVGYHSLSLSLLPVKMGASSRLVGITTALVFGFTLASGSSVISFFPKPLLGGLIIYLGLSFLTEWLYDAWFKLPKTDYWSVWVILVVIATVGFLQGVAVGLVIIVILFVINYSQIDVTKQTSTGAIRQSNVVRAPEQIRFLQTAGEKLYILELQGFIFFGTANKLLEQIQKRVKDAQQPSLQFVMLDFRLVKGLDSSAVLSFNRLEQLAQKNNLTLVYTNLSLNVKKMLRQGDSLKKIVCQVFPDLDRGLEWCEEQFLEAEFGLSARDKAIEQQLQELFLTSEQVPLFMKYLEVVKISKDYILFKQDELSKGLYFLESGQVSVFLCLDNEQTKRLRTYNSGTIIGEMGLYQQTNRSASVIADRDSQLYYLSRQAFDRIRREKPDLAADFHLFVVSLLAERLRYRENELRNLLQ